MSTELLDDVLEENLKIVFCGMAAGKISVEVGGYYAKSGNRFWGVLKSAGFTNKIIKSCNYEEILNYNLGLTDLVKNQSGVDSKINYTQNDIKTLKQKISDRKPNILAFNGKKPASAFLKKSKKKLSWGEQIEKQGKTKIWVLPSTSGLNGMWNRHNHKKTWKDLYKNIQD